MCLSFSSIDSQIPKCVFFSGCLGCVILDYVFLRFLAADMFALLHFFVFVMFCLARCFDMCVFLISAHLFSTLCPSLVSRPANSQAKKHNVFVLPI